MVTCVKLEKETVREKKKEIGDSDCGWITTNRRRKRKYCKELYGKSRVGCWAK